MVLPLASTMCGQKVLTVHIPSKENFQPSFPKMKEEKFHLQPWNWPWKKQNKLSLVERLHWVMNHNHTNSPLVTVGHFMPSFLTWTKLCILRIKPDPHLGFKLKAEGTVVILPQHHLPNAALGLHRGWCRILNFAYDFHFHWQDTQMTMTKPLSFQIPHVAIIFSE